MDAKILMAKTSKKKAKKSALRKWKGQIAVLSDHGTFWGRISQSIGKSWAFRDGEIIQCEIKEIRLPKKKT